MDPLDLQKLTLDTRYMCWPALTNVYRPLIGEIASRWVSLLCTAKPALIKPEFVKKTLGADGVQLYPSNSLIAVGTTSYCHHHIGSMNFELSVEM